MVSPNYPPNTIACGVGDFTRELSREIVKLGNEIVVIASDQYIAERRSVEEGIRVVPFGNHWNLLTLLKLFRFCMAEKFDCINLQYSSPLYGFSFKLFFPLLRLLSPVIISFHSLFGGPVYNKWIAGILIFFSSKQISTNEEVDHLLTKVPLLSKANWVSIPIGSNINRIKVTPEEAREKVVEKMGFKKDDLVLTHFGLYYPGKGVETMMEALGNLKREFSDFHLLMLGAVRPGQKDYYQSLVSLAEGYELGSFITWVGYQPEEDVSLFLSATDIYLVPYDQGVSSRRGSLMAGLSHALPIISTLPSIPFKYFKNNENLLLVPPRASSELQKAILDLMRNSEKRESLRSGAELLYRQFSWENIAEETVRFLKG